MYRYSSEFQISSKHVVFLSYLHFDVSANTLVLNNKYFSVSQFSLPPGSPYVRWVPRVWTDITQRKEDVEQQVIIFIIDILGRSDVCQTKYKNIFLFPPSIPAF